MTAIPDQGRTADATPRPRAPSRNDLAHIPGERGWPVVGNTLEALADPLAHARRMHGRYGPVNRDFVLGRPIVGLLGPEGNEFFFLDPQKLLSSQGGWDPILGRLFPRGPMMRDFDEHRAHRRALSVAFKSGPMHSYLAGIDRGVRERVETWRAQPSAFRFYPAIKQLTLDLAATSFLGVERGVSAEVKEAFVAMVAASVGVVRVPFPGTLMAKGVASRARIVEILSREVPRRRDGQADDIFSTLCRATHDDGALLSTQDIVDHMSFLMMAAHDTLTSSMTSLVWLLATHPDWQARLREEAQALGVGRDEPLCFDRLADLPLAEMAFKEAMRINPPVPALPRLALRAFEFGGYRIPAGAQVGVNPLFTHHMPEVWPDPETFDPLRFTETAVRERHRFAWVPFGGGAHMCLGLHFATMQTKCIVHRLLTAAHIDVPQGYAPKWRLWPIPQPRDGLPVRLRPAGTG